MKIRTDFVTNSSSSSFVALLVLDLDNDKSISLSAIDGNGDFELERHPSAHYVVEGHKLNRIGYGKSLLEKLSGEDIAGIRKTVKNVIGTKSPTTRRLFEAEEGDLFDGAKKIVSGRLIIQEDTYGEYFYEADPETLLDDYIMDLSQFRYRHTKEKIFETLRNDPRLERYTDKALLEIAEKVSDSNDHGPSTIIIQKLNQDGTLDLSVDTGEALYHPLDNVRDPSLNIKQRLRKYKLDKINFERRAYDLAEEYYKAVENKQTVEFAGKKFYIKHASSYSGIKDWAIEKHLGGIQTDILDNSVDYICFDVREYAKKEDFDLLYEDISKAMDFIQENWHVKLVSAENLNSEIEKAFTAWQEAQLKELIDPEAEIVFRDKHFVLTGFGTDEEAVVYQIRRRGGIFHNKMVKRADYLVACYEGVGMSKIREATEMREKGSAIQIVSDEQFRKALEAIPVLSITEFNALEEERENQKRLAEEEKLKAKQEEAERKAKRLERAAEARKAKEEAKQQRAAERAETAEARRLAEEEKLAKKEEARKAKEAERLEAQRIADEKRAEKQAALAEARANANILYAPGEEPEPLHTHIQNFMAKLDEAYPDHVIVNLAKNHTHWDERVTELYRRLGYADRGSFLEAYGFKVCSENKGGRPTTLDPETVIEELKRRYPDGTDLKMSELIAENKDLPIKTLQNNAKELLGMSLGQYLKQIGILK